TVLSANQSCAPWRPHCGCRQRDAQPDLPAGRDAALPAARHPQAGSALGRRGGRSRGHPASAAQARRRCAGHDPARPCAAQGGRHPQGVRGAQAVHSAEATRLPVDLLTAIHQSSMRAPAIGAIAMSLAVLSACAGLPEFDHFRAPGSIELAAQGSRTLQVAANLEAQGDTVAALALYQRATATSEDALIAYIRIGEIHMRTGNFRRAIDAFRAALALDPGCAEAMLGLGSALVRSNDVAGGLAMLRRAAPMVGSAIAYNRLGLALTLTGNLPEAAAGLARAAALGPDDRALHLK